jgi:CubicO group peptidase (beta-lactamase class C family)
VRPVSRGSQGEAPGAGGSLTSRLEGLLDLHAERDGLSCCLLVARGGEILYERSRGTADPESGQPLSSRSPFNLASATKPFTALCVLQLAERELLRLDDDIRTWLPEAPCGGVSVRHLLTHTSGLPEYFEYYEKCYPKGRTLHNSDVLEIFRAEKPALKFAPGAAYDYCNTGYVFLALIAEAACGSSLAEYVKRNVIDPAGMDDAFPFEFGGAERPGMVRGFEVTESGPRLKPLTEMDGTFGDGNLYASVTDLRRWADALAEGDLLSLDRLEEALVPFCPGGGGGSIYGLGWRIDPEEGFAWHTGSWAGFRNYVRFGRGRGPDAFLLSNSSFEKRDALVEALNGILS